MIVEDDPDFRESMQQLLEFLGHQTIVAENGYVALRHLCRMETLPNLILLELIMPVMNGWQLLQELQRNALFAEIPVIVVSALDVERPSGGNVIGHIRPPLIADKLRPYFEQNRHIRQCAYIDREPIAEAKGRDSANGARYHHWVADDRDDGMSG